MVLAYIVSLNRRGNVLNPMFGYSVVYIESVIMNQTLGESAVS